MRINLRCISPIGFFLGYPPAEPNPRAECCQTTKTPVYLSDLSDRASNSSQGGFQVVIRNVIAITLFAVGIGTTSTSYSLKERAEPTVVRAVAPVFSNYQAAVPAANRHVVIRVRIDNPGNVKSAENVSGIDVNGQAKQAALRWKFSSTDRDNSERVANLTFVFQNMPEETSEEELTPIFKPPFEIEVRRRIHLLEK